MVCLICAVERGTTTLYLGSSDAPTWYCWQAFLSEGDDFDPERQGLPSMSTLLRARPDLKIVARIFDPVSLGILSCFMATIICSDVQQGHTWKEAGWFAITAEPVFLLIALAAKQFCYPYASALEDIVEMGTDRFISDYRRSLEERSHDWRLLTVKHQELDSLLERVWHELYGWVVLQNLTVRASYGFAAGGTVLAAHSVLAKAARGLLVCSSLLLIGKVALKYAYYTERCIRRSAATIHGEQSIMRVAMEICLVSWTTQSAMPTPTSCCSSRRCSVVLSCQSSDCSLSKALFATLLKRWQSCRPDWHSFWHSSRSTSMSE
eukprot:TRINITY_DN72383_c0_g1_i2.p1 TRINITY_DN72383_c0_g1~~TRINITY_DN72383_c0_g1_i2.p1  ORF type:complete len:321 (-),score=5.77 TRINITY_DN72383_c0_g1_i2:121-1083(-)